MVALDVAVQSTVVRVVITLYERLSPSTSLLLGIKLGKNRKKKR